MIDLNLITSSLPYQHSHQRRMTIYIVYLYVIMTFISFFFFVRRPKNNNNNNNSYNICRSFSWCLKIGCLLQSSRDWWLEVEIEHVVLEVEIQDALTYSMIDTSQLQVLCVLSRLCSLIICFLSENLIHFLYLYLESKSFAELKSSTFRKL